MSMLPSKWRRATTFILALIALPGPISMSQPTGGAAAPADATTAPDKPLLKAEEIEQLVAPIALYPDSLLTQMLMASTYPLEVVQADRWVKANKGLTGDALAAALEKQDWDPSVKSLVNFPDQLSMMSDKLDLTIKIGDAFIEQQADVLNAVQVLRNKAASQGNLKTNDQQVVQVAPAPATTTVTVVQAPPQVITIESPTPQIVYVPTYDPTVVYGVWPYPAYVPVPYYPPYYVPSRAIAFGVGVACGVAWGYAWGRCDWGRHNVSVDINRNVNFNRNINRTRYQNNYQGNRGNWQHNPSHRKGVAYRDNRTTQRFGGSNSSAQAVKAREQFRGRTEAGNLQQGRGSNNQPANRAGAGAQNRPSNPPPRQDRAPANGGNRGGAFDGANRGSGTTRAESQRGQQSRGGSAAPRQAPARGGGGGRGGGRR